MIPFMLDPKGVAELHRIRDYAHSHPVEITEQKIAEGSVPVVGDNDEFFCLLPPEKHWPFPKFKVVYSIEEQPKVTLRHLSVSILDSKRMPDPLVVEMIMKELGFIHPIKECQVWIEENYNAVNVADLFERSK